MPQQTTLQRALKPVDGSSPKKTSLRPDIQGLRAVAVLAVIADHLFAWPAGGFIGVDIFFVISGFLITGILVREQEKTGRISFTNFYRRRVRRILPIAVVVLAVTVGASWLLFLSGRAQSVTVDAIWSALFSANWHFAINGTDYLKADGPVSPLQHFWSLSVEEQFYVLWPWLVVLLLGTLAARMGWTPSRARRALGVAMVVVCAASFSWALWETQTATTVAYFSTFSRAWELGVGALLAVSATTLQKLPHYLRPILGWTGLAGIAFGLFFVNAGTAFPAPGALVPVLATALLIAAGTGGAQRFMVPLTNRITRYVGDISYSLYLWHFPVIILVAALMPPDALYNAVVLVVMAALSVLSYHFVEDPIRRSSWLEPATSHRYPKTKLADNNKLKFSMLAILGIATVALCVGALQETKVSDVAPVAKPAAVGGASAAATPAVSDIQASVVAALSLDEFPTLNPALADLASAKAPELIQEGCLNPTSLDTPAWCNFGDPNAVKKVVVVGDSIALSYLPGIRAALEPQGYNIHGVGLSSCPFANVSIVNDYPGTAERCNSGHAAIYQQILDIKPNLVIVSDATIGISKLASKASGAPAEAEWTAGLKDSLTTISASGARVVVLSPNPPGLSADKCVTKFSKPKDCIATISGTWRSKKLADANGAAAGKATYVDTSSWFCSGTGSCPLFASGIPIRWDDNHLTKEYSQLLAPQIAAAIAAPAP